MNSSIGISPSASCCRSKRLRSTGEPASTEAKPIRSIPILHIVKQPDQLHSDREGSLARNGNGNKRFYCIAAMRPVHSSGTEREPVRSDPGCGSLLPPSPMPSPSSAEARWETFRPGSYPSGGQRPGRLARRTKWERARLGFVRYRWIISMAIVKGCTVALQAFSV
jgi:hypothetical protein